MLFSYKITQVMMTPQMAPGGAPSGPRLVKLTQLNGKRLLVPGSTIRAVETLSEAEVRRLGIEEYKDYKGPAVVGVWLDTQGVGTLFFAVLRDMLFHDPDAWRAAIAAVKAAYPKTEKEP